MMSDHATPFPDGPDPVRFRAVLYPHRSLSPAGFRRVMAVVGIFSLGVGILFFLNGAWPVVGFMGVDVLLLYWAFSASYGSARAHETVELTDRDLIIERVDARAQVQRWVLPPNWLRVQMDDPPRHHSQITLITHGKRLVIGTFLSLEERVDLARALRDALARWRG